MDNINNAQTSAKSLLKRLSMIVAFAFTLVLSTTSSNAFAVPPEHGGNCEYEKEDVAGLPSFWCCWTETDAKDPEQIEIYKCQHCWIENGEVDCAPPVPDPNAPPTTKEDIAPENTGGIEQPPTENTPPIRSDNSVPLNEDSAAVDEEQPKPNSPLTDQRFQPGNVGVLEQLEDSSNSESGDSVSSENPSLFNAVPQNPTDLEQQTSDNSNDEDVAQNSEAQR